MSTIEVTYSGNIKRTEPHIKKTSLRVIYGQCTGSNTSKHLQTSFIHGSWVHFSRGSPFSERSFTPFTSFTLPTPDSRLLPPCHRHPNDRLEHRGARRCDHPRDEEGTKRNGQPQERSICRSPETVPRISKETRETVPCRTRCPNWETVMLTSDQGGL